MSELKTILERAGRSLPDLRGTLDDVHRRRARHHRNRRITAGVVAMLVAATGTLGAIQLFDPGDGRPSGVTEEQFFALWPETTLAEAQEAQDRADASEDEWQTDAKRTAAEFFFQVMGTPRDALGLEDLSDPRTVCQLSDPPVCPEDAVWVEVPGGVGPDLEVHLRRLVRRGQGGIWSVVKVSWGLEFHNLEPGAHLQPGAEIFVRGRPENTTAAVRYCAKTRDTKVRVAKGKGPLGFTFQVPDEAFSGCRGFVMVARGVGNDIAPLAQTMFDPERPPGLCHQAVRPDDSCDPGAATALAIVPVIFDVAEPEATATASPQQPRFGYGRIPLGHGAPCPVGPLRAFDSQAIRTFGETLLDAATDATPRQGNAAITWDLLDPTTQSLFTSYQEFEAEFMGIPDGYPGGVVGGTGAVPPYNIDPQIESRCGREIAVNVYAVELYWSEGESIAFIHLVGRPNGLMLWYVE